MLEVTFVRRRGGRDRVYVTREDGTSTGWDFPSYGDVLPHDLCDLVVEDELRLADGFWGLIDQGVEVGAIARLASPPDGRSPASEIAEVLGAELPESATPDAIAAIRDRLRNHLAATSGDATGRHVGVPSVLAAHSGS